MIKIAICDDNNPTLDFLYGKIDDLFTESEMKHEIHCFQSGNKFLESHSQKPFDVVFLDIIMPEMSGFEAAKQVRKISRDTYIIFITSEDSLVYESLDFQPFNFIPKNENLKITEERLRYVIKRLSLHIAANEKIEILGAYDNQKYVSPSEILYIKSSVNNIEYHMNNKSVQTVRGRLDDISKNLNVYIFARTHNRCIVNMSHIDEVDYPNMEIKLDNDEFVKISRGYKKEFEEAYLRYTRNFS